MTQIIFYHNSQDRISTACALVMRAYQEGHKVVVRTDDGHEAMAIDRKLWTQPPIAFVPHCLSTHALAAQTPILIAVDKLDGLSADTLINLHQSISEEYRRFDHVVEIVDQEPSHKQPARVRFKTYRDQGFEPTAVDLSITPLQNQQHG